MESVLTRRHLLSIALAIGASAAWAEDRPLEGQEVVAERPELFPQGVASGDPDPTSIVLWTRYPLEHGPRSRLRLEVAEDELFSRVVARSGATVSAASDWTCRVLVGNLKPAHYYWYRFVDTRGRASRVGRTSTAPPDGDGRPAKFAFVSCQNINHGAQNAYRRMIFEDKEALEGERLGFVLHLGDFIYNMILYPEDRPNGFYGRPLRDMPRFPHGEKIDDFYIPTTVEDYRTLYRAYLSDPDIQDARARWPFVCIWDNEEFSTAGWQSLEIFDNKIRPAQVQKVAANQAWFEYQPARVAKSSGPDLESFGAPDVQNVPITRFDERGLGDEPNNRAALASLTGYRALRWGRHVELLVTDQRSYRSEPPTAQAEAEVFTSNDFPLMFPQEALEILDAARAYGGGRAPATIRYGLQEIPNFRREKPVQTILGTMQKEWFLARLARSEATWKIWGNTIATLDCRIDPQNLPPGLTKPWPGAGYAAFQMGDFATAYAERAEIYASVRDEKITGFVTVCGNSHAFYAGFAAPSLPPQPFAPIGLAFVTSSLSPPGIVEVLESTLSPQHPLYALYLAPSSADGQFQPVFNMLIRHGVRSCLEYQRTGDVVQARRVSNPALSPHLAFSDFGGHGYATVRASSDALECEFVCVQRPLERAPGPDGGPVLYRVVHRAPLWNAGETPKLEQRILEGNPELSL